MVYFSLVIKACLVVLALATSPLVGVILSRMTKEELSIGKKYFKGILWSLLIVAIVSIDSWFLRLIPGNIALSIVLTSVYFFVVTFTSLRMSK